MPNADGEVSPPRELLRSLSKKDLLVCLCRSSYDAMAELVMHERELRRGADRVPMVLMIVEPSSIRGAKELVRAASVYAPQSASWRYSANEDPPVAAFKIEPEEPGSVRRAGMGDDGAAMASAARPVGAASSSEPAGRHPEVVTTPYGRQPPVPQRPAPGGGAPKLRLAWGPAPPEPRPAPAPTPPPAKPAEPPPGHSAPPTVDAGVTLDEIRVGEPRPITAEPEAARPTPRRPSGTEKLPGGLPGEMARGGAGAQRGDGPGESRAGGTGAPLLSDEELAILLWDTWYPEMSGD